MIKSKSTPSEDSTEGAPMSGFLTPSDEREVRPEVFLQWKGTDACMDFHCECGAHCHFDGDFAYCVKCPHCGTVWEMPCLLYPRKAAEHTHPGHVENARLLEPDEDHCDEEGNPLMPEPHRWDSTGETNGKP